SMLCLLLLPAIALAKPGSADPIARMTASGSVAIWTTAVNHDKIALTVSGPDGSVYQKEFAAGVTPMFRLQDLGGKAADGSYTYEMRIIPNVTSAVRQQLAAAREAGDDAAAARIQRDAGLAEQMVRSGTLSVSNGPFIDPDAIEPVLRQPAAAASVTTSGTTSASSISPPKKISPLDIVQADDVIIQGSLCVGLDCVVNESFGFDTIRLKENNTRIHFDDTSTSTGFPNHNWQLTANDSNSGGANKFSIEDLTAATVPVTVTGSAPNNAIFVDSTGRVGFRTATPVLDLHLATGNTPAHRFEQNTSGGFTAQTWDIAGNEANFFVRDVTGGSRLPFRIRPGAPTSSIDIAASGNVGIGTASPGAKMDIGTGSAARGTNTKLLIGGSVAQMELFATNKSAAVGYDGTILSFFTNGSSFVQAMVIDNTGNVGIGTASPGSQLVIANGGTTSSVNAGATQFTVASSRTFKENIEPADVPDILQKIEAVPVVTYDFKNNGPKNRLGLIAEDFHEVLGRGDDKHIDGQDVQMALWMAVQKLTAENKALTERLSKLE